MASPKQQIRFNGNKETAKERHISIKQSGALKQFKAFENIHLKCNQNEITLFKNTAMGAYSSRLNQQFREYFCKDLRETSELRNWSYQIREDLEIQLDKTFMPSNHSCIDFSNTFVIRSPVPIGKPTSFTHQSCFLWKPTFI